MAGQLRATVAYRFTEWLSAGVLLTGNGVLVPIPGPFWAELGARAAFRW